MRFFSTSVLLSLFLLACNNYCNLAPTPTPTDIIVERTGDNIYIISGIDLNKSQNVFFLQKCTSSRSKEIIDALMDKGVKIKSIITRTSDYPGAVIEYPPFKHY